MKVIVFLAFVLIFICCGGKRMLSDENAETTEQQSQQNEDQNKDQQSSSGEDKPVSCPPYKSIFKVQNSLLDEISGLKRHSKEAGFFWVHNDSGSEDEVYLISDQGKLIATYQLDGVDFNDPEDMTAFPCKELFSGENCLVIADIGDNGLSRSEKQLYLFKEPQPPFKDAIITEIKSITLEFPFENLDGETIFYDEEANKFVFVTKKRGSGKGKVYSADPFISFQEAKVISDFPVDGVSSVDLLVTAGEKFGSTVILRNYKKVLFFNWLGIEKGLEYKYSYSFSKESQGEAIDFDYDGKSFFTVSEGNKPDFFKHDISATKSCNR